MYPVAPAADSPTARVLCALRYPSQTTWRVIARQLPSQLAACLEAALAHHGACLCDACAACVVSGAAAACAAAAATPSDGLGRLVRGLCREFPGLEERLEHGCAAGVESVLPSRRRVRVEGQVPQDPLARTSARLSPSSAAAAAAAAAGTARATFMGHLQHRRYAAAFDDLVYAYLLAEGGAADDERSRSGTQTLFSLLGELCRSKEVASGMAQYLIEQDRQGCPHRGTIRWTKANCSDDPVTLRGWPAGVAVCPAQLDGVRVGVLRRDEPPLPVARRLAPFLSGGSEDGGGGGGGDDDCGQDVVWVVLDDYKRVALPTRALLDPFEGEGKEAEGRSWGVHTRVSLQWTHDALANTTDATWRSMLRGDAAVRELYATRHSQRFCEPPGVLAEPSRRSLASVLTKEAYDSMGFAFVQGLSEANAGNVQGAWVRLLVHPAGSEPVVLTVPLEAVEVVPPRVQDFVLAYVAIARGKEKVLRDILDQKCLDVEQAKLLKGHLLELGYDGESDVVRRLSKYPH